MASSFTGLGTELMTTGENAGTWGTTTNTNLQIIEQIAGGYVEQSVTSTPTTLSVSDGSAGATLAHRVIKFTGTISANTTVTVPLDVQQMYILLNGTAGAYTLTFKYASGSGSTVAWAATDKGTKLVYATADHATNPNMVDSGIGSTAGHDLDGNELILDADADTSITADTDDQIDIRIAGADDFQFTANTFTAQSGSTIAAQALTATTVTASGIVKTDDTTEATSTTDGSLQTDGGLSVAKDAVLGDDVKLLSDSAVLSFGADSDVSLTHVADTALLLNAAMRLQFRDSGLYIGSNADGDLDVVSDGTAVDSINLESAGGITLDAGTAGSGIIYEDDGTEMARIHNSSSNVILETKVSDADFSIKGNDGGSTITPLTFDMSDAGKATFSGNVIVSGDLTVSGDDITMGTNTAGNLLVADGTNFNSIAAGSLSEISTVANDDVFIAVDTSGGGLKKIARSAIVAGLATSGAISNVVEDTSPQLGGDLDTNSANILIDDAHFIGDENGNEQIIFQTTGSAVNQFDVTNAATGNPPSIKATGGDTNIDFDISAKGTGHVTVLGGTNSGAIQFNCESNSHGQIVIAQPHSAAVTNTLTLPAGSSSTLVSLVSTDTLTNKTLTSPQIGTSIIPSSADGATLGSASKEFSDLFLADSSTIQFGNDQDTTLTHTDGTGLTLNSTNKLCFNDASQFIQGSSATVLSIGATDEIDLTATAVDLNGTLNVSGVATFQSTPVFPDGSIAVADLDIDGATDIGEAIVDADLFVIDNGAGGTNRKTAASRLVTYINANSSAISDIVEDTSPQLGGNLDTNSHNILIDDAHFIADENGNEQIIFQTTGSAVNQFDVTNAATGNDPTITATGGDSNVGLGIVAKGTGVIQITTTMNPTLTSTGKALVLGF